MKKGIEFTQSQIKAFENGATMFIIPTEEDTQAWIENRGLAFIEVFAPIQKGDEFFIQEEFFITSNRGFNPTLVKDEKILYRHIQEKKSYNARKNWIDASQMQEYQSRYRSECIDIRTLRVHNIAKTGYFDGADIDEDILKGLGLKWMGYMSRESHEEIGCELFKDLYNNQLKEQKINRTHEDNDYLFLVQIKGIEK